jgi:hypothetical protein
MSAVEMKPRLSVVGEKTRFRSVEIAERRENHDAWELADAIYQDVVSLVPDDKKLVVATTSSGGLGAAGIKEAEERVYDAHTAAGTEIGRTYLRAMFDTVRVWPPEDRLYEKASFVVHSELRGKDYPNRREVIQRLAAKSDTGRVSWSDLRRWKSERKPARFKTFLQIAEDRIRKAVHDAGKPWHMVAADDRAEIVRIIRTIADEIEAETFA